MTENLDPNQPEDQELITQLRSTLGDYFAQRLMGDKAWSKGILVGEKVD